MRGLLLSLQCIATLGIWMFGGGTTASDEGPAIGAVDAVDSGTGTIGATT